MSPKDLLIKLGMKVESFLSCLAYWFENGAAHTERLAEARVPVITDSRLINLSGRNATPHWW